MGRGDRGKYILCKLLYKKGSSLFELMDILSQSISPNEVKDILNNISKSLLIEQAYEDKLVLEEVFVKRVRSYFLSESVNHMINFFEGIVDFLESLKNLNFEICSKQRIECLFEKNLNVKQDTDLLKLIYNFCNLFENLKENIMEDGRRQNYLSVLSNYQRLMKLVYTITSLLSFNEIKLMDEELKKDPLTGLLNRRFMNTVLSNVVRLAYLNETSFTIALIDVDNFKRINDHHGHEVGDCVLKQLANLLKNLLRKGDYIFRYGGEEFLIILPSTRENEAKKVLERIREGVESFEFFCNGEILKLTVSIGACTVFPDKDLNVEECIANADKKLYMAKNYGKNLVVI